MGKIVILANRLAESILMNWNEEDVIKLAKEVAVTCKENIDFISLVKRMREAQEAFQSAISSEDIDQIDMCQIRMLDLEREVDEYLKKIE